MADVQQNYLPGGLTREQMEQALAMSQGSQPPMVDPVAPQPAAPPPVAPPQEALDPAAGLEAPAPAEPPLQIERERGRPRENIEAYTDANVADANAIIANKAEMGDEHGMTPEAHKAQQAIHERSGAQNKATADSARSDVEARKAHEADMQAKADRIFAEMEANKQPPPESVSAKVMGVIGSILTMAGNKPGVGRGVEMLMDMIGSDKERWAMERAANSGLYQSALAGVKSDREGAVNDQEVAQRMAALEALEINDSLNGAKEAASSDHAKAYIEETQRKFMMNVRGELLTAEIEKQKQLDALAAKKAAAAKSGKEAELRDALWRMKTPVLLKMRDGGGLSELGHKVLAEKLKEENAERGAEDKHALDEAEARKKAAEVGAGPKLTEGQQKLDMIVQGAAPAFGRLSKIPSGDFNRGATKEGWIPDFMRGQDTLQQRADIKNLGIAVLRAESGASFNKSEIEEKFNALPVNSGDPEVRAQGLLDLLHAYKALDAQGRLNEPAQGGASKGYTFKPKAAPSQAAPEDPRVAEARALAKRAAERGPGGGI